MRVRKTPWSPIFDADLKYGAISPGAQVGCTPTLTIVGSVQHADLGNGDDARMIKDGNIIYLQADIPGSTDDQVVSLDVSDPTNPVILDVLTDTGFNDLRWGFQKHGDYLYVVNPSGVGISGLYSIDVSNPAAMFVADHLFDATYLSGPIGGFVKEGNLIYGVSYGDSSVYVVDVTNPAAMTLAGGYLELTYFIDNEFDIVKEGDYLYASSFSTDALVIFDVSNPSSISRVGFVQDHTHFDGPFCNLVKVGNYIYATGSASDSLVIFNVTNPAAPTVAGWVINGTYLNNPEIAVLKDGNFLYAPAYSSNSLAIFDVSNPASPTFVGGLIDAANFGTPFTSLIKRGTRVFAISFYNSGSGWGNVVDFDVSDPTAPVVQNVITGDATILPHPGPGFILAGNYLYVQANQSFVVIQICG